MQRSGVKSSVCPALEPKAQGTLQTAPGPGGAGSAPPYQLSQCHHSGLTPLSDVSYTGASLCHLSPAQVETWGLWGWGLAETNEPPGKHQETSWHKSKLRVEVWGHGDPICHLSHGTKTVLRIGDSSWHVQNTTGPVVRNAMVPLMVKKESAPVNPFASLPLPGHAPSR